MYIINRCLGNVTPRRCPANKNVHRLLVFYCLSYRCCLIMLIVRACICCITFTSCSAGTGFSLSATANWLGCVGRAYRQPATPTTSFMSQSTKPATTEAIVTREGSKIYDDAITHYVHMFDNRYVRQTVEVTFPYFNTGPYINIRGICIRCAKTHTSRSMPMATNAGLDDKPRAEGRLKNMSTLMKHILQGGRPLFSTFRTQRDRLLLLRLCSKLVENRGATTPQEWHAEDPTPTKNRQQNPYHGIIHATR